MAPTTLLDYSGLIEFFPEFFPVRFNILQKKQVLRWNPAFFPYYITSRGCADRFQVLPGFPVVGVRYLGVG